ncbi:hypothetical protein IU501_30640 [Nocardia otitidiscaviarum]|uniref:hypothetical protein n=1 Tax=Nocardia otitidiscaviarum TaxID=1823 RepID=UPI0006939CCB|nr:hypothetical protein [Nocardia otitidiscaviarum]MBF6137337.1 hypothetical protein [Nocardia otitidiscaviarum]MBF6241060.1 hypothetical protein [Nocardia otitidiscaviarum]MBF6488401.1 hypothetical protein [Nocardia otitidiscaviarum]
MTIRHAPLFVIALPVVVAGLQLAGMPASILWLALLLLAAPVLMLLLMPADTRTRRTAPRSAGPR